MKKVTLGILGMIALISCSDKNTDLLKENLKTKVRLSDSEIESTQFKTTKMLASDGKIADKCDTCHSVRQNIFFSLISIGITIPLGVKS